MTIVHDKFFIPQPPDGAIFLYEIVFFGIVLFGTMFFKVKNNCDQRQNFLAQNIPYRQ